MRVATRDELRTALMERLSRAQRARRGWEQSIAIELRYDTHVQATVLGPLRYIPLGLLSACHRIRVKRGDAGYDVVHDTMRATPYWEAK